MGIFGILKSSLTKAQCLELAIFHRCYSKPPPIMGLGSAKKKGKVGVGATSGKIVHPVETDANKIVNYVCGSNIYKTGEDIKLKPDSEYPDWLWTLHTGPAKPLEELDPNTKEYWRRIRRYGIQRNNRLNKVKKF